MRLLNNEITNLLSFDFFINSKNELILIDSFRINSFDGLNKLGLTFLSYNSNSYHPKLIFSIENYLENEIRFALNNKLYDKK